MDEPPKIRELDFSIFHDLMHPVWSHYCTTLPGGRRRHIALWWDFVGSEAVRRNTLCLINKHLWTAHFRTGVEGSTMRCRYCVKLKP